MAKDVLPRPPQDCQREAWEAEAAYRKAKDAEMRELLELAKENGRKLDAIIEQLGAAHERIDTDSNNEGCSTATNLAMV